MRHRHGFGGSCEGPCRCAYRSPHRDLSPEAWRGSSSGCDSSWLLEERGTPLAPGGLGRPCRLTPRTTRQRLVSTEKSGRPARADGTLPTPGAHHRALHGAKTRRARVACNLPAPRRANRHVPAACNWRVPAACNRHVPAACNQRHPAHRDACKSARPAASNHNPSPLSSAAGKVCDIANRG